MTQINRYHLLKAQAEKLRQTCDDVIAGRQLASKAADHCIGIASYVDAVAREVKAHHEKELV